MLPGLEVDFSMLRDLRIEDAPLCTAHQHSALAVLILVHLCHVLDICGCLLAWLKMAKKHLATFGIGWIAHSD